MAVSVSDLPRLLLPALLVACGREEEAVTFVGSATCGECHADAHARWQGSHHERAMQPATPDTVLGDFAGTEFEHHGVTTRFLRAGEEFRVRTEGADGAQAEFRITHTFGVEPLQQYLVATGGGRLQALGVAWDTRPRDQGGQRWFHVYGEERIPHDDVLHWTHVAQNWNSMCAECHATDLRQGVSADGTSYTTTWSELGVGCEACHGPGSQHVAWGRSPARDQDPRLPAAMVDRSGGRWVRAEGAAVARRTAPPEPDLQLDACAQCHARRTQMREAKLPHEPLLQTHLPALLREGLYFADGQIQDEVYVWGSFVQSRMYHAGVRCNDCHDPHSLRLRVAGDALCAQCHDAARYGTPAHHHHAVGTAGSGCVDCHMPARNYMVVDPRRDHSFRVPRPDLSQQIGTPNACNGCHTDRDARWAAEEVARWRGDAPGPAAHFALALHAGRERLPGHAAQLRGVVLDALQPAIVRATALELLGAADVALLQAAARDDSALLRHTAAAVAGELPAVERVTVLGPLLRDEMRAVRSEAGRSLAALPEADLPAGLRATRATALSEWTAAQRVMAGQPGAHASLGNLESERAEFGRAAQAYRRALALEPGFVPARVNLADLFRATGDDARSVAELERALRHAPESADVRHALGLALVRVGRREQALEELAQAARLEPRNARYALVHAVALRDAGSLSAAAEVLARTRRRLAEDPELLALELATQAELGQEARARALAEEFVRRHPQDPRAAEYQRWLKSR